MAVALSLHLDQATAGAVQAVWAALAQSGESREMRDLGYVPHLTLVVVEDDGLAPALVGALPQLARLVPRRMELGVVEQFAGTSVTWVSYAGDPEPLARLHSSAVDLLPPAAVHQHYRLASWTPHITLATAGSPDRLIEIARSAWRPRHEVWATRLEVVRFPPPVPLAGLALSGP